MINFVLKFPNIYRLYQKFVRGKRNEYSFINYIIEDIAKKRTLRMLDLCSGDSYILEYSSKYINNYMGVDNNDLYLKKCVKTWKKYTFLNSDISNFNNLEVFKKFNPNFIFMMGALHHFDNYTVRRITSIIKKNFPKSIFLSVDPVRYNNGFLNNLMIYFDRGKFIRNKNQYNKLIKNYKSYITDDFYKMSFKYIFHYRNINFNKYYLDWRKNK